jgi:hypothetical protein
MSSSFVGLAIFGSEPLAPEPRDWEALFSLQGGRKEKLALSAMSANRLKSLHNLPYSRLRAAGEGANIAAFRR